jgi:RNA polymerase sigma factor (sigma-70 family)
MATVLAPSRTDRAFERLYRHYAADVYRYVLAVLQNKDDAEDATQTAFLSAYRAYERGERPERPLNWLIAIAHNVCRQRFRESARRPRIVELQDDHAALASDEEAPNAEDIRRALGFLAFNQRAALVMRELQGHSYAEIGGILGLSTSAVETLLFRARRAMREQLEGGLTCGEAERALSKRADGELSFSERGPLRAHLRECPECAGLDRRLRFRRGAVRIATFVPLPSSLSSFFGGGAATSAGVGVGVGAKAAAVVVAGVLGSGVAGDGVKKPRDVSVEPAAAATVRPGPATERSAVRLQGVSSQASWRSSMSPRPRPARRSIEAAPSVAPAAAAGAAAAAPPVDAAEPGVTEPTPNAPEPRTAPETRVEVPAVPNVPVPASQPAIPPPAPAAPIPPERPELPTLPAQPALPELPKPELPQLPELPKPDLPGVPGLPPLNTPATPPAPQP